MYKYCFLCFGLMTAFCSFAQPKNYTVANTHSHNDYKQDIPFYKAYEAGFGSIEADVFLQKNQLIVAHEENEMNPANTIQHLYLQPLDSFVKMHKGYPYADTSKELQLLIDLKTDSINTLRQLVTILQKFPALTASKKVHFVITGNRPDQSLFATYPPFILFDGELSKTYTVAALERIVMLSDDLETYTHWNGKGNPVEADWIKLTAAVTKAHNLHKKVRFWDAPDFVNAWMELMKLGVDYINTDHINELAAFINNLGKTTYTADTSYQTYIPTYKSDGVQKPVKNILLFIGDGCSYPQLYAGYTANKGHLNIFNMRNIGLSKTSSYDNFITDSAPGSTAISSGTKTRNRYVGAGPDGKPLLLLPIILQTKNIKTGLVSCGDITDATPADFYAHQTERDNAVDILRELKDSKVDILMGSGDESLANVKLLQDKNRQKVNEDLLKQLQPQYTIVSNVDSVKTDTKNKWLVIDANAGKSMLNGRGNWLADAFAKTLTTLKQNKPGFFIMTEGAQIDYGGHANNLGYVATEVMDFDKVIGDALRFADADGETLVIVTADHETGGLTLLGGDYDTGYISGNFSTNDHTALPVPVFAYGPQSNLFTGVYENTVLFNKILQVLDIKNPAK